MEVDYNFRWLQLSISRGPQVVQNLNCHSNKTFSRLSAGGKRRHSFNTYMLTETWKDDIFKTVLFGQVR